MKTELAVLALAGTLAAQSVYAQLPPGSGSPPAETAQAAPPQAPAANPGGSAPGVPAQTNVIPAPVLPDPNQVPSIPLPTEPVEPYLLTKDVGPFMVLAKTFRGPEAERYALALVLELRHDFGLPAYILRTKDFPRRSNIRNVPPTAAAEQMKAELGMPERMRSTDEAAVLVGNATTLKESEKLLHTVKKIKPKCLDHMPKMWIWREGLSKAIRTTNPYVPTQNLFPGKVDTMVQQMNQGPHSVYQCPGRYTLEVANFSGRATFNVDGATRMGDLGLKRSPLATAAEDAEKLASALEKAEEIRALGEPVYVYHDRTSSRVMIGSFSSPSDPKAIRVHDALVKQAVSMMDYEDKKNRKSRKRNIDKMLVPANALTDLEPIKPK
jgi:hypothetical protein